MRIHAHAHTITFTCKGEVCTIPGIVSGQLPYHDVTHGIALECQM